MPKKHDSEVDRSMDIFTRIAELQKSIREIVDVQRQLENKLIEIQTEVRSNHQEMKITIDKQNLQVCNNEKKPKSVKVNATTTLPINKWFSQNYISDNKDVLDTLNKVDVNIEGIRTKIEEDNKKKKKKDKKEVIDKRIADTVWKSLSKQDKDKFKPLHDDYKTKKSEDETKDLDKEEITDDDE